jgi:hypothetical protein
MASLDLLNQALLSECDRLGRAVETIGSIDGDDINVIHPSQEAIGPSIMVMAGLHGDEIGGPWGILKYLQELDPVSSTRLTIIPYVNPTGIRLKQRHNKSGQDPNDGFIHDPPSMLSDEGRVLMNNYEMLFSAAHDGLISLHEDVDMSEFYLYVNEEGSEFSSMLFSSLNSMLEPLKDPEIYGDALKNSVATCCLGSFEDLLYHNGVPFIACTEMPGLLPFPLRVNANALLIKDACNWFANAEIPKSRVKKTECNFYNRGDAG